MKVSLNWIKEYIDISLPINRLVEGLISLGLEIESVENQSEKLTGFVIGKVVERKRHPNADKLTVCKVDIGTGKLLNIVCGAPNVDAGQTVCVARVGAIIPNGEFEIKKARIRGEDSEGMICSAKEMNLGDDHTGIMVLEDRLPIGSPFAEYLGYNDTVLDIGITPNRGDLLSYLGLSREIGVLENKRIRLPDFQVKETEEDVNDFISVEIENPAGCYRYCGRLVKRVKVKESPEWLKSKLISSGLRPINNIVDITNFVMLESGQPLHAFDYDLIEGKRIIVKDSGTTASFTTLDGKKRGLREDILLICDSSRPVALAGIMGGENSEINDDTVNVFIESAYFDPVLTRKSSKFLGLQTDSSYRFERGIDIENTPIACDRAAQLMSELGGGDIARGLIDVYPNKAERYCIGLRLEFLSRITGINFAREQVIEILNKIELKFAEEKAGKLFFEIPLFRKDDLQREIDLVEEIARIYGYENIPDAEFDQMYYDTKEFDEVSNDFINNLRSYFASRGYKEIISDTLVDERHQKLFNDKYVRVLNPFSNEMNVLRSNLYVGALVSIRNNLNFKAQSLKLFEVGDTMCYSDSKTNLIPGIAEDKRLLLTAAGDFDVESVNIKTRSFDIFDLKGELQVLLEKMHIDNYKLNHYNYTGLFDYSIDFSKNNRVFGRIFKYSDNCLKFFDIDKSAYGCEIMLNELMNILPASRIYSEISKYPPVLRDLSVVVDAGVSASEVEEQIVSSSGKLLKKIRLYDVFEQAGETGKKSYTFSLEFSSSEKTLTDEEINSVQHKIVNDLRKKLKAELRA